MLKTIRIVFAVTMVALVGSGLREQQTQAAQGTNRQREAEALAQPFKGVTAEGTLATGLYSIKKTGVTTAPVKAAAESFLASLDEPLKAKTVYPVDSNEWRDWHNVHRYERKGVSVGEMSEAQRQKAWALLQAGLSARGFTNARDIMRLNETIGEMTGRMPEYGEGKYHFTVMGTPSMEQPWGWQLDGHHLVVNYFILGDQVVMTPTFMGSEPVKAESGKYAGTQVFVDEEANAMSLMKMLTPEQQTKAIVAPKIPAGIFTAAFRDNFEMKYEGLPVKELSSPQQAALVKLIETYVGNMRPGHDKVRMDEVKKQFPATYFAWMGGTDETSVFYYRIHSPVILIEFDHQGGTALKTDGPSRNHIHTVVRTPNGNDYGKDLLRLHHERVKH